MAHNKSYVSGHAFDYLTPNCAINVEAHHPDHFPSPNIMTWSNVGLPFNPPLLLLASETHTTRQNKFVAMVLACGIVFHYH